MSIVALRKITLVGLIAEKADVLTDLQELGCLQIIPLTREGDVGDAAGPSPQAREALRFLLSCPTKQQQVTTTGKFDAERVETESLALMEQLRALEDERDFLVARLRDTEPWGEFVLSPLEAMGGQRLWFYVIPHRLMAQVEATDFRWEIVNRDARFCYVVVVSEHEPEPAIMPVLRTRTGDRPRSALAERLEEVELELEDVQAARIRLTRWCVLLARNLDRLEDRSARDQASTQTYDSGTLFALQAWAPVERMDDLRAYAVEHALALEEHPPSPDEAPPTLFENPRGLDAGESLVTFYMTPSYWTWDPSSIVFLSFAVFFAMILSDAGYGLLLAGVLLYFRKRLGQTEGGRRFRVMLTALTVASIVYGVVVGSYFGVSPKHGFLARLHVLDMNNLQVMMLISVVIGVTHIVVANVMNGLRYGRDPRAFAPFGWSAMVAGGFLFVVGRLQTLPAVEWTGVVLLAVGALLVFLFTGAGEKPVSRTVRGLLAFTRLTAAFGDVLSYLRLFALGLATASLALAFNDMASGIREAVPGVGLLFALLLLLFGHALNFILGLASGVIHGLRLNVIEFFNWGVPEEGRLYQPFARKESATWNRSS